MKFKDLPQGKTTIIRAAGEGGGIYATNGPSSAWPAKRVKGGWRTNCGAVACVAVFAPDDEVEIVDAG